MRHGSFRRFKECATLYYTHHVYLHPGRKLIPRKARDRACVRLEKPPAVEAEGVRSVGFRSDRRRAVPDGAGQRPSRRALSRIRTRRNTVQSSRSSSSALGRNSTDTRPCSPSLVGTAAVTNRPGRSAGLRSNSSKTSQSRRTTARPCSRRIGRLSGRRS